MKRIAWDDSLSIGIDAIDGQHQTWIARYNNVVDAIGSPGSTAPVVSTLDFLIDYTELHFATEEGFMRESGYPSLEAHKAKHEELRRAVADLGEDFEEEGSTYALGEAVETLLGNWLIDHIQSTDQFFGAYVREGDRADAPRRRGRSHPMSDADRILDVMTAAGEPLNVGRVTELSGLDRKAVDKAMAELKKAGRIESPVRCYWAPKA